MKWIKLKIYQGDKLLSEVETVESKYDNMINEVRCSDIKDSETKINFLSFREEIEQRIIELDEFYQLNINDTRVGTFLKVRNRLASLLEINIDEGNKIIQKTYLNNNTYNVNQNRHNIFKFDKSKGNNNSSNKNKLFMSNSMLRKSSIRKSSSRFGR